MAYSTKTVTTALPSSRSHTVISAVPYVSVGSSGAIGATGAIGPGGFGGAGGYSIGVAGGGGGNYHIAGGAGGMGGMSITSGGMVSITGSLTTVGGQYVFDPTPATSIALYANGMKVPEGDKFSASRDLFTTDLCIDGEEANHFHYLVWIESHGSEYNDYGVVLRNDAGCYITFGSEKSRDHFEAWFDRYEDIFFKDRNISEAALPGMVTTALTGTLILDPKPDPEEDASPMRKLPSGIHYKGEVFETWAWIVENCHSPVVRLTNGWLFTGANDAVLFRMK